MLDRSLARRRAASLLALAAGLLLAGAGTADAGTYTVYACQTPSGAPARTDGWSWSTETARVNELSNQCPGTTMSFRMLPQYVHPSTDATRLTFVAPPYTKIARYRMWRSVRLGAAERYYYAPIEVEWGSSAELRVLTQCGGVGAVRGCSSVGDASNPFAAANLVDRIPPRPLYRYGMYLSCGHYGTDAPDCRPVSPISAEATIYRADTTLQDDTPPAFATEPAGSLRNQGAALSGVHTLSAIATDRGGGIASTALEVDGTIVGRETFGDPDGNCREPYTKTVPCPATASGTLSVDTTTLADGAHQLRVLVTDVAGNTSTWGPAPFTTDNARIVCDPQPAAPAGAMKMEAWVAPEPPPRKLPAKAAEPSRRATVPMGRGAVATARLTDGAGAPVAGAGVCVATRAADDEPLTVVARTTTDADGRISAPIPAGTSRQIWAVHRSGGAAVAGKAVMRVPAGVTMRPLRKRLRAGQRLTMRGRLSGRPIPRTGVLVNVQARRGRRWQTFRQVRVHQSGRFRVRYRFSGAPGVHRYALRATVPAQGAYHYAPATSRPFRVRVAG